MTLRLLHTADLHIGKRVNGMSMIEEQEHVIDQLVDLLDSENFDGVLIAGDVFDRAIPSREALETCERLFSEICSREIPVFVIPGNHDSPQQLAFCSHLLELSGLHIAKAYDGHVERFELARDKDRIFIHLLPFVRPTDVRMAHLDAANSIKTHQDALIEALSHADIEEGACNILVAHQFVTSVGKQPETCESEIISLGGADNVDVSVFDAFDYVALGHLHGPQHIGRETVRYSGSPLKYSFSEIRHKKSFTVLEVDDSDISLSVRHLEPLHEMREISASYKELVEGADKGSAQDYMRVLLTDRSLPDAMAKIRALYPNIMRLEWQDFVEIEDRGNSQARDVERKSPLELFADFYELQTGEALGGAEHQVITSCMEELEAQK